MLPASLDWSLPCLNHPPSSYASLCPLPIVVVVLCPSPLLRPPIAEAPLPSLPSPASLAPSCSAVDSRVGRHIFHRCIGPGGVMDGRTRLLVTHQKQFLPLCDRVLVIRKGRVAALGAWRDLKALKLPELEVLPQTQQCFVLLQTLQRRSYSECGRKQKTALLGPSVPHISLCIAPSVPLSCCREWRRWPWASLRITVSRQEKRRASRPQRHRTAERLRSGPLLKAAGSKRRPPPLLLRESRSIRGAAALA